MRQHYSIGELQFSNTYADNECGEIRGKLQ